MWETERGRQELGCVVPGNWGVGHAAGVEVGLRDSRYDGRAASLPVAGSLPRQRPGPATCEVSEGHRFAVRVPNVWDTVVWVGFVKDWRCCWASGGGGVKVVVW